MISSQEHWAKASRNESLLEDLGNWPTRYTEWEITVMFYSALHYVSAFLSSRGEHPENHYQRRKLVVQLTSIAAEYENLQQASQEARYDFVEFSPERVEQLRTRYFQPVKAEMLQRLSP